MRAALLAALLAASPVAAQVTLSIEPPSRPEGLGQGVDQGGGAPGEWGAAPVPTVGAGAATTAPGGIVRVLDKIDGTTTDLDLAPGETRQVGSLTVTMGECRYPTANPAGDAFTLVSIRTVEDETALFEGWLVASAPALNAMDHPRYDVWALRCRGV